VFTCVYINLTASGLSVRLLGQLDCGDIGVLVAGVDVSTTDIISLSGQDMPHYSPTVSQAPHSWSTVPTVGWPAVPQQCVDFKVSS